jgi:hypothetical protein
MTDLTTSSANTMLTAAPCVPTTVYYLSLHTGSPGTTGANEISGGSYIRQAITFGSASAGSQSSSGTDASQSFTGMPAEAGGAPYFGIWTASTSGTYLAGGTTSGLSGAISSGSTITFASGGVTLSLS